MLLLVKLKAPDCNFTKSNTPPWVFFALLNCIKKYPNQAKLLKSFWGYFDVVKCSKVEKELDFSVSIKPENFSNDNNSFFFLFIE